MLDLTYCVSVLVVVIVLTPPCTGQGRLTLEDLQAALLRVAPLTLILILTLTCAPSTQIVCTLDPDCVHPRPRLCAPSTQIVYTLDPDSRLSKAKTAHWLVSNVKSLSQLLNFSPVYSLVKLFHRTL